MGLYSVGTHWNSSLRDLSSTWNFYARQLSQNSGTRVFKTRFAIDLKFLKFEMLVSHILSKPGN